jgi:DNA segregation ATPase FtsK/SpoIIIE-like protein
MSDRTKNGKSLGQDASGFLFCLVGGFFAVSLALFLRGQEPKPGIVSVVTSPVVQLGEWIGPWAALALSVAVAVLGSALFLRRTPLAAGRWLAALAAATLGLAFVLGAAFDRGGDLGALFPGLITGLGGSVLGLVLGAALAWIGWSLVPLDRGGRGDSATDAFQRLSLSGRQEAAAGVSHAETALLASEPRAPARREEPVREGSIRPYTPPKDGPAKASPKTAEPPRRGGEAKPRVRASEPARGAPAPLAPNVRPLGAPRANVPEPADEELAAAAPPAPAWEQEPEDDFAEPERVEPAAVLDAEPVAPESVSDRVPASVTPERAAPELEEPELAAAIPDQDASVDAPVVPERPADPFAAARRALEAELALEDLDVDAQEAAEEDAEEELEAGLDPLALESETVPPGPAWEQVELFDEEEETEEHAEEPSARPAQVELTPTFDFGGDEPRSVAHEPEVASSDDPFAGEPVALPAGPAPAAPADALVEPTSDAAKTPSEPSLPAEQPEVVLQPEPPKPRSARKRAAPAPEPVVAQDAQSEGWSQLVFDAGCAILEQNRVAVSMLERRFALDFDQACRILDELQAAGLIGPYMGGRTRDILLTREEWLAHAPQAS